MEEYFSDTVKQIRPTDKIKYQNTNKINFCLIGKFLGKKGLKV